jgi:hypothetical protein
MGVGLVQALGGSVYMAWVFAAIAMKSGLRVPLVRFLYHELKPFYWPCVTALFWAQFAHGHVGFWDAFGVAGAIVNWLFYRNIDDDDDRWKRRRRKVAERIAAIGGRLTVVPAGTS